MGDLPILTLKKWLSIFNRNNVTFHDFTSTYKVKSGTKIYTLKEYANSHNINKENLHSFFKNVIEKKQEYLHNFFNRSLKINNDIDLSDVKISLNTSNNQTYKNIIRNLFYKQLLLETDTDIKGVRPFLSVLIDLYNKKIIDYKLLTPSGLDLIKKKQYGSIMSGFYFRSSILNPAVIFSLSKKHLLGEKIFTPTLGLGSYMYGYLCNENCTEYVGTDVIPYVCNTSKILGKTFFPEKKINIFCQPSETLLTNKLFKNKYKNYFDTIFFSPPYYKLEIYKGGEQSTSHYDSYEEWLEHYWHNTIKLCKYVANKKCKLCYIISSYINAPNLVNDLNNITKKYFKHTKSISMENSNIDITKHRDTRETIFFFTPLDI